jgi:glutaredoxin
MHDSSGANPFEIHSMVDSPVILYTREGCHLCDDALNLLMRHRIRAQVIDIDADPDLQKQFGTCVPVVVIDGKVRFRGRVNEILLKRLINRNRDTT